MNQNISFTQLLLAFFLVQTDACLGPFFRYGNSCYHTHNVTSESPGYTYFDARDICVSKFGGDLVSSRTANVSSVWKVIGELVARTHHNYWVGLNNLTGKLLPNRSANNPNCYKAEPDGSVTTTNCELLFGFICEMDENGVAPTVPTLKPIPRIKTTVTCEVGWMAWADTCYEIVTDSKMGWLDAQARCANEHANLLTIESQEEQDFFTNIVRDQPSHGFWIGLNDRSKEGNFVWENGSPVNFKKWKSGEPNDLYRVEDCVSMHGGRTFTGMWFDDNCRVLRNWICEKNAATTLCPENWINREDFCYQLNFHPAQRTTWGGARRMCQSEGADLVSFTSEGEEKAIHSELRTVEEGIEDKDIFYWIGLLEKNNLWRWADRSPYRYHNWYENDNGTEFDNRHVSYAKSAVSTLYGSWRPAAVCSEKHSFVCKMHKQEKKRLCNMPLGMQSYEIPDAAITTNSQMKYTTPAIAARLYQEADDIFEGAWCAEKRACDAGTAYLQINLQQLSNVTHIGIQGKPQGEDVVTKFHLTYSMDGSSWDTYRVTFKVKSSFLIERNSSRYNVESFLLDKPIVTKWIRVYPVSYHKQCCLRLEIFGCRVAAKKTNKCGLGWEEINGDCYYVSSETASWDNARSYCQHRGAHLLSIPTEFEESWFPFSLKGQHFWTGLNDLDKKGIFRWSDGSPLKYVNWAASNPKKDSKVAYILDGQDCWHRCQFRSGLCTGFCGTGGYCCRKGFSGCPSKVMSQATSYHHMCVISPHKVGAQCVSIRRLIKPPRFQKPVAWYTQDCYSRQRFICRRKEETSSRMPFSTNWKTEASHYLPLDRMHTSTLKTFGLVSVSEKCRVGNQHRDVLSFEFRISSFVKITANEFCVTEPLSKTCARGFTISFLLRYPASTSASKSTILYTSGYEVSIALGRLTFKLTGESKTYTATVDLDGKKWNHYIFTWKPLNGLKTYLNGNDISTVVQIEKTVKTLPVYINPSDNKTVKITSQDIVIGASKYATMKFTSLALYERALTEKEVKHIFRSELGSCGPGKITHGSYCYQVMKTATRSHYRASRSCHFEGGEILSIHSPIEQAWLNDILRVQNLSRGVILGINGDISSSGRAKWNDGTSLSYSYWAPYMPKKRKSHSRIIYLKHLRKPHSFFRGRTFWTHLRNRFLLFSENYHTSKHGHWEVSSPIWPRPYICKSVKDVRERESNTSTSVDDKKNKCTADGYTQFAEGTCFKLYLEEMTVDDAQKRCDAYGAELATMQSREEEMMMASMMVELYKRSNVWIGVQYDSSSQTYKGSNGGPVVYTNWYNGNPDPRNGKFVTVSADHPGADGILFWNVANEKARHPFFCVKREECVNTTSPTVVANNTHCPSAWKLFGGNCYFILERNLPHFEAPSACGELHESSNLASIEKNEENSFIFQLLQHRNSTIFHSAWIGLTNEAIQRGFAWRDGRPLTYINWYTGNPRHGLRNLCVGMNRAGKWWEVECGAKHISVCKMVATVPASSATTTPPPATTKSIPHTTAVPSPRAMEPSLHVKSTFDIRRGLLLTTLDVLRQEFTVSFEMFVSNNSLGRHLPYSLSVFHMTAQNARYGWNSRIVNVLIHPKGNNESLVHIGLNNVKAVGSHPYRHVHKKISLNAWHNVTIIRKMKGVTGRVAIFFDGNYELSYSISKPKEHRNVYVYMGSPWGAPASGRIRNIKISCPGSRKEGTVAFEHAQQISLRPHGRPHSYLINFIAEQFSLHFDINPDPLPNMKTNGSLLLLGGSESGDVTQDYIRIIITPDNWMCIRKSRIHSRCDMVERIPSGEWTTLELRQSIYARTRILQIFFDNKLQLEAKGVSLRPQHNASLSFGEVNDQVALYGSIRNIRLETLNVCEPGWRGVNNSCYFISTTEADFDTARSTCRNMSAYLTSIGISHENNIIRTFLDSPVTYIGLSDRSHEDGWQWSDHSPVSYVNWADSQPDDAFAGEDCVGIKGDGTWIDLPCNRHHKFICKKRNDGVEKVDSIEKRGKDANESEGSCDVGWTRFMSKCYLFKLDANDTKNFREAVEECVSMKGNLASVHSLQENAFIVSRLTPRTDNVWIGLTDGHRESKFRWTDQSRVGFTYWALREPNNVRNEDCVHITGMQDMGRWNDQSCEWKYPFVCQKPVNMTTDMKPEPTRTTKTGSCPPGYEEFKDNCYKVVSEPVRSWKDASLHCRKQQNGDLMSVSSSYVQAFLFAKTVHLNSSSVWIGLRGDGALKWSDGTPLLRQYWKNGRQPSMNATTSFCVSAHIDSNHMERSWTTRDCSQQLPFVCQVSLNPVIESPSFLGNCAEGWTKIGSMCYMAAMGEPVRWEEAQSRCEEYDGNLVTINSIQLQKRFTEISRHHKKVFWIGLNDREEEGMFRWVSGSSSSFVHWNVNEPNNVRNEDCAVTSPTGYWNDRSCAHKLDYICEHSLWCRQSLGVLGGWTDSAINVTSHVDEYGRTLTRSNDIFKKGVCFDTLRDSNPALTIHLGDLTSITRIKVTNPTLRPSVTSYTLDYSEDGIHWFLYTEDNVARTFITSQASNSSTMQIRSRYIRFRPLIDITGVIICAQLELYGCKAECSRPFGLSTHGIRDNQLTASSNPKGVGGVRPPYGGGWCSERADTQPWFQIRLDHVKKITRMLVEGNIDNFTMSFGLFENRLLPYRGYNRKQVRIFTTRSNLHQLEYPQRASIARFHLNIRDKQPACVIVELYGCEMKCAGPLGMESGRIKNSEITASSQKPDYPSYLGRLKRKGWCAAKADPFQYLQIKLPSAAKVTHIATQGVGNDSFVERYFVQWSREDEVFLQLEGEMAGNTNANNIMKIQLKNPLEGAEHIRIFPKSVHGSLCMRVEVYGCLMTSLRPVVPDRQVVVTPKTPSANEMSSSGKVGLLAFFVALVVAVVVAGGAWYYKRRYSGVYSQKSLYSVKLKDPDRINIIDDENDGDEDELL